MSQTVPVIGVQPEELTWIRLLIFLLRHPDPVVSELTRQGLLYLEAGSHQQGQIAARIPHKY